MQTEQPITKRVAHLDRIRPGERVDMADELLHCRQGRMHRLVGKVCNVLNEKRRKDAELLLVPTLQLRAV